MSGPAAKMTRPHPLASWNAMRLGSRQELIGVGSVLTALPASEARGIVRHGLPEVDWRKVREEPVAEHRRENAVEEFPFDLVRLGRDLALTPVQIFGDKVGQGPRHPSSGAGSPLLQAGVAPLFGDRLHIKEPPPRAEQTVQKLEMSRCGCRARLNSPWRRMRA